ncbi:MAG: large-conductance mechanosensitive channel protein MscL [Candidatus Brocadiia bacterium]|nr:MAG: large-conductance mechanosensitive channel protein MscL [Candidatus Brocadiia bacterium]
MISEFKTFAMRGNVADMAVGIVIGGAFGKIVTSLVGDIIMPLVGMITAGSEFKTLKLILKEGTADASGNIIGQVTVSSGAFVSAVVDFVIIAFAIFLMVKAMNFLRQKEEAKPAPAAPNKEEILLSEIRDILKAKA